MTPEETLVEKEIVIHPIGTYGAKIVEVFEPQLSATGRVWFLRFKIVSDEHPFPVFSLAAGYPNALIPLYRMRKLYLNKPVQIRVKHRVYSGTIYPYVEINWDEASFDS